ncbi:MAG: glycoside hydrolase family 2 protein [Bacteroides nordii]
MKKKIILFLGLFLIIIIPSCYAINIPRPEYPRPQFERADWINLNGTWTYTFDFSKSGMERFLYKSEGFKQSIIVPFCPESSLSGVDHKDFINAMWYQRKISIPSTWEDKCILLNFGGVDYKSIVYINGQQVFIHYGGSSSFSVDITPYVKAGSISNLVVYVEDDLRQGLQTAGKQSLRLNSYSCHYTRVTGIWQTVWMEAIAKEGLKSCRITPDLDNKNFIFEPIFYNIDRETSFKVRILDNGKEIFVQQVPSSQSSFIVAKLKNVKTWSPESPFLYDIEFTVLNAKGETIDKVNSYAGMRKVELRGKTFYLNNQPYYQRLVLDQGYYPDGQWTAPNDAQLKRDIELGKEAGFNGARLHQKVFEQRYFYWADKLGYLTWGESASWGVKWEDQMAARNMITEWEECVYRDYNAPSLVIWSPLNETWKDDIDGQRARLTNDLYFITKRIDRTRPVVTTSGGYHAGFTDIYAEHTYVQDPVLLYKQLALNEEGYPYVFRPDKSAPYKGEAYIIDEFGGIQWFKEMKAPEVSDPKKFWGYGAPPKTLEEFYQRLEEQVNVILSLDHIIGFCYTQIVDVELEKNGIYTYDRNEKFDMKRIRQIFSKSREQAKEEIKKMLKEREIENENNK